MNCAKFTRDWWMYGHAVAVMLRLDRALGKPVDVHETVSGDVVVLRRRWAT